MFSTLRRATVLKPYLPRKTTLRFFASKSTSEDALNSMNMFNEIVAPGQIQQPSITRVKKRGFTIGNINLQGGVCLMDGAIFLFDVSHFDQLKPEHFTVFDPRVINNNTELLIIGTGAEMHPLKDDIAQYLKTCGIQYEVMNSRRAAATFNILVEEDRQCAAALLPVEPVSAREPNSPDTDENALNLNIIS